MKEKTCPRCGKKFMCNHEDITKCQCATVKLDSEQLKYVAEKYNDCLCHDCLIAMSKRKN